MGESLQSRRTNRNEDLHGFADFNSRFQGQFSTTSGGLKPSISVHKMKTTTKH